MNKLHIAELLREDYTTVVVSLNSSGSALYPYKVLRAHVEQGLYRVGGCCLTPSADKMKSSDELRNTDFPSVKAGVITCIHENPDIDFDAEFSYKWLVAPLDLSVYKALVDQDKEIAEKFKVLEETKARESVKTQFMAMFPEAMQLVIK